MIKRNNIYRWLFVLALLPITLTACLEDEVYGECPSKAEQIQLTLTLPEQTRIATNTRATSERVDYSIVNNLNLVLAEGTNIKKIYYFNENSITPDEGNIIMTRNTLPMEPEKGDNKRSITIKGEEGEFDKVTEIYAIANYNKVITVTTIDALKKLQQSATDGQPGKANDCMMFGSTKQLYNGKISLERTLAMFSVKIDGKNLNKGVRITPKRISLHNVPTSCFIGLDNKINNAKESVAQGQVVDVTNAEGWGALTNDKGHIGGHEQEPGTIPMFMFENLQGVNESITGPNQQVTKHPKEYKGNTPSALQKFLDEGQKYTYILVEAEYYYQDPQNSSKGVHGSINYRFLVGNNIYNDFNINRNTYYQVTLTLKDKGGASEDGKTDSNGDLLINNADVSWRVEMDIEDWGFVKNEFDFDCHAQHGYLEVVGSDWTIKADKGYNSFIKFYSEESKGWVEPTAYGGECGVNGKIEYFVQTWGSSTDFDGKSDKSRSITISIYKNSDKNNIKKITLTQWTPIKIANNIWVERFEEEEDLAWGYQGDNMSGTVSHGWDNPNEGSPSFNKLGFEFGENTKKSGVFNTWFMYYKKNEASPAQVYCFRKNGKDLPHGAPTSTEDYYCLPDANIMKTLMNFKYEGKNPFQPLRTDKDYWTGSVDTNNKTSTYYLDSSTKTLKTTQNRNDKKRVRAVYVLPYN